MDHTRNIRNAELGNGVRLNDFINLYECKVGNNTKIGTFVEVQKNAVIGNDCKISSHSFICEGVQIGNGVFIGHNVSFINDRYPAALNKDKSIKTENDWTLEKTIVEDYASIGTGATIMCGGHIGKRALIGAGSLVLHDIPDDAIAAGNPAKIIRIKENER